MAGADRVVCAALQWTYDREVSAWSHPAHEDQAVLSREAFTATNGIDPDTWPATSGFQAG